MIPGFYWVMCHQDFEGHRDGDIIVVEFFSEGGNEWFQFIGTREILDKAHSPEIFTIIEYIEYPVLLGASRHDRGTRIA